MSDSYFRLMLLVIIGAFFVVRAYHHRKAETEGGKFEIREPNYRLLATIRLVGGLVMLSAFVLYFVSPAWISIANLPFPDWLRGLGVVLGVVSVPLLWWIEITLGKNFRTTLHLREDHTLVTDGPYHWVRHPMYTALVLWCSAVLLISANALVGLPGLLGLLIIISNRIAREEGVMIERFGDMYRDYMRRTGRFLPRLVR
jgi:protein-S-isoprenylcysteine O-methyltransferase Ste14